MKKYFISHFERDIYKPSINLKKCLEDFMFDNPNILIGMYSVDLNDERLFYVSSILQLFRLESCDCKI